MTNLLQRPRRPITVGVRLCAIVVAFASLLDTSASAQQLPSRVLDVLPEGYRVVAWAGSQPSMTQDFTVVALAENAEASRRDPAPARPLLIFRNSPAGIATLVARNDYVVLRADEGGQCDPFEFGRIFTHGPLVAVENNVACGMSHWTDVVTFRFDASRNDFVFDHRRTESWQFDRSNHPDAEALVSDGAEVERAGSDAVTFAQWRRDD